MTIQSALHSWNLRRFRTIFSHSWKCAAPNARDGARHRIAAKRHGACAVLLATWEKGKAARFFSLGRKAGKRVVPQF